MSEWRETWKAIKLFGPAWVFYARFIYPHHMRLIHRLDRHKFKKIGPLPPDGEVFWKCDWCGVHTPPIKTSPPSPSSGNYHLDVVRLNP